VSALDWVYGQPPGRTCVSALDWVYGQPPGPHTQVCPYTDLQPALGFKDIAV